LPISIDQCEPPLQFIQIQTIDFRYWDRTSNHRAFLQLSGALAKRLEASAIDAQPRSGSHTLAALSADASADAIEHRAKTRLKAWIAATGLRFPETVVEKEYQDYLCEKTFIVAQFVYGAADMAMDSGGVLSTRFRFMIALPLMVTFFALSFRPFARRHSQAFLIAFGVVGMACTYINVCLIAADSPFRIDNGNATMNAMLLLGFLALVPLNVGPTIVLGSIVVAVHAGHCHGSRYVTMDLLAVLSSCQLDVHGRLLHCVLARALLSNGICGRVWMARCRCLLEFAAGAVPTGPTWAFLIAA